MPRFMGVTSALVFANLGAAYGTAKSGRAYTKRRCASKCASKCTAKSTAMQVSASHQWVSGPDALAQGAGVDCLAAGSWRSRGDAPGHDHEAPWLGHVIRFVAFNRARDHLGLSFQLLWCRARNLIVQALSCIKVYSGRSPWHLRPHHGSTTPSLACLVFGTELLKPCKVIINGKMDAANYSAYSGYTHLGAGTAQSLYRQP